MIEVITCPPLNSIQDGGRYGHRALGVGTSGAMDNLALRLGNILLGNDPNCAVIEVQMFPFELRFDVDREVAVTGAVTRIVAGDMELPSNWCFTVRAGQTVRLDRPVSGARCYVAVRGGFDCPVVLDSRSTSLRSIFGGHQGRALRVGDRVTLMQPGIDATAASDFGVVRPADQLEIPQSPELAANEIAVRAIPAGEYELFTDEAKAAFWASSWKISVQSNRMGYRFAGPELKLRGLVEMRSYGVVAGLVQVPPGGQPIVQLSDANTMGGYPKIAAIIEADLWRMGQVGPGQSIRFVGVSYAEGCEALGAVEGYLGNVQRLRDLYIRRPHI